MSRFDPNTRYVINALANFNERAYACLLGFRGLLWTEVDYISCWGQSGHSLAALDNTVYEYTSQPHLCVRPRLTRPRELEATRIHLR